MYEYSFVLIKQFNRENWSKDEGKYQPESDATDCHMIAGIDIGGTKIAVGVVDHAGRVLAREECPTAVSLGFVAAMHRTSELLRECVRRANVELHGIGIGSPGPVDPKTGRLGDVNNLPGWEGGNPVEILSREFGVPAALENDADAAALGELRWGAGKSRARFLYVTIGTGIGASLILDGQIYRGINGCHPEIGHHIIDPSGPACSCGTRGCWESLAAGPAMTVWLRENSPESDGKGDVAAREIFERAENADRSACAAVEREAFYLGLGLANLITLFAPEAIVLGGGVMRSAPLFMNRVREVIHENCRLVPTDRVEISLAALGADAGLIGAAEVWNHRFQLHGGEVESRFVPDRRGPISS
jgi:glucokinase